MNQSLTIPGFQGDIDTTQPTRLLYSSDASVCQVMPVAVVFPRDAHDIQLTVQYVSAKKQQGIDVSLAMRGAGTCMSGGSLTDGIVIDTTKYMNALGEIGLLSNSVLSSQYSVLSSQPGVFYRTFEKLTHSQGLEMPVYPASHNLCAIGGMFGNNCGGEKSLRHGKAANWIIETRHVFADGNEYAVRPLNNAELEIKMAQNNFEGHLYKSLYELIQNNYDVIAAGRPQVSKNSAGYYLWNVWDRESGMFDLNQLLCGSQGTLGLMTQSTWRLHPVEPASKMIVMMLPELSHLGDIVNTLLQFNPNSIESYDDASMKLAVKFFPDFIKQLGVWGALKLGFQFIPELGMIVRGGVPKLVLCAEFTGASDEEIDQRLLPALAAVRQYNYQARVPRTDAGEEKYWIIRRESFNLLRKHLSGKRTAPFIDDICVDPKHLAVFLPRLNELLQSYHLTYTIAGHAGNGNFHIIPLMDFHNPKTGDVLLELSDRVYTLVREYHGSITAEHNDGIIRTPYLHYMFDETMLNLFQQVKQLFDPLNMFNPGKKVGGTIDYLRSHIKRE